MRRPPPQPFWIQIVALCLMALLIGFFIYVYFNSPNPTIAQSNIVRLLYPLLTGFAASFISGGILLLVDMPVSSKVRLALSASAGLAIFIFVYRFPPYWYQTSHDGTPSVSNPTATPIAAHSPIVANPTATPMVTPTISLTSATQAHKPTVSSLQIAQMASPTPTALIPHAAKTRNVLLLIEDGTILQVMLKKMGDYGLRATSGDEFGKAESRQIRALLPQVRSGNPAAISTIPFAVVVTGRVASLPKGDVQGAYLVDATAHLNATVIASGEVLHETVTNTGGGQDRETALQNALREVAANIPEIFFRQINARAR